MGDLVNRTEDVFVFEHDTTGLDPETISNDYNAMYIRRAAISADVGLNLSSAGSVLKIENVVNQSSGILNDSTSVLKLLQDTDSTGAHINMNAQTNASAGTKDGDFWFDGTDLKIRVSGVTYTLTKS